MANLSWAAIVRLVHERAHFCCEYCQTCQLIIAQAMHVEHINPSGGNELENLCLSCPTCNFSKAKVTSAFDLDTGEEVALFNPRIQNWHEHFEWIDEGVRILGITSTGRATVLRLKMNQERVVISRTVWVEAGLHPPKYIDS